MWRNIFHPRKIKNPQRNTIKLSKISSINPKRCTSNAFQMRREKWMTKCSDQSSIPFWPRVLQINKESNSVGLLGLMLMIKKKMFWQTTKWTEMRMRGSKSFATWLMKIIIVSLKPNWFYRLNVRVSIVMGTITRPIKLGTNTFLMTNKGLKTTKRVVE